MNKTIYILILLMLGLGLNTWAQENKTETLKTAKVKSMKKYIKIYAIGTGDTCLTDKASFNPDGMPTYQYANYNCMGYRVSNHLYYTYNKKKQLVEMKFIDQEGPQYNVTYAYNKKGDLIKQSFFYPKLNNTSTTTFKNFKNKKTKLLDSVVMTEINPNNIITNLKTNILYSYNKDKQITYIIYYDSVRKKQSESIYEYNNDGLLTNQMHTFYGEQIDYDQTTYEYTKQKDLATFYDLKGRPSHLLYDDQGLIKVVSRFNDQNELDSEIYYYYEFYD